MRVSRLGVCFSLIYLVPAIACVALALSSDDSKGRFVFLQLPIGQQLRALHLVGLNESLHGLSWATLYLLLCLPVVVTLYCIGWGLGLLLKRMS
uniref:Uncharacterized protein n=1 Tax=Pseudomonas fluorescens TaxID=294 RepID=A0A1W6C0M5_PSEFL|nr:hypothetical protein [Pseudomonas fluorescens]